MRAGPAGKTGPPATGEQNAGRIRTRYRISTLLFSALAGVAVLILAGLLVVAEQLGRVGTEITALRDQSLPRLVKLSQLSQEASASIAIAPALSTNPTRYEFETLLSRIKDKTGSQDALIADISALVTDTDAIEKLKNNAAALAANQTSLTTVVRRQIDVRKRLEKHIEAFRRMARDIARQDAAGSEAEQAPLQMAATIQRLLATILDTNRARFSRNRKQVEASVARLQDIVSAPTPEGAAAADGREGAAFFEYWASQKDNIFRDKSTELTNAFKIKALVEENSLIANRLISTATTEFSRASAELTAETQLVASATRNNIVVMTAVVAATLAGSVVLWILLQRLVLRRLDRVRAALRAYSQDRRRDLADRRRDEIGDIAQALSGYMDEIDAREAELQKQTDWLQRLSGQLSRYLSPQVYESIFSGRQAVEVASTRKKLTVFFSDIVSFTETADRMESEELTGLLNDYLNEMTQIALAHGATIDKYIGDAIMIFFGDPETNGAKADALACVTMAIAMRDRLNDLAGKWRGAGIERPLNCRFGIHTGYCTVGNFGSDARMDYTIIGGTVNAASRIQTAADPGQILISYETHALVRDAIDCREMGKIEVKGIAYPLATYEALDLKTAARQQQRLSADGPGLNLELDVDTMTADQVRDAAGVLQRALSLVERRKTSAPNTGPHKKPDPPASGD